MALLANQWKPAANNADARRRQQYQGYRAIGCVGGHKRLFPQFVARSVGQCRNLVDLRRILPPSNARSKT